MLAPLAFNFFRFVNFSYVEDIWDMQNYFTASSKRKGKVSETLHLAV